ncbi:MAG: patatin-like phospholipase family protein [Saprospiraceae bacterium]|nr:patatin-like phospholipase family protein [Candidatus Opimibacter skivensis]
MKLETKEVIQKQAGTEREDIHIGLVLAGAVTAGAYTAGVLDYLLNTLDFWYEKHAEDPKNVAKPNVIIDAITGASAGSIVAAVTLMALATKRYKNVDDPTNLESDKNLLF